MNDYHPDLHAIEAEWDRRREKFRKFLMDEERPDLVAEYDRKMREIDTGVEGARNCWHSISGPQRFALVAVGKHGGRLIREGKEYRHRDRNQPYRPIYVRTVRALCAHDLLAWDGGAFDPEAAAVITERGMFVLRHGLDMPQP